MECFLLQNIHSEVYDQVKAEEVPIVRFEHVVQMRMHVRNKVLEEGGQETPNGGDPQKRLQRPT